MAEGGGTDDQSKSRRVRLMCPHPPRPFQTYRGPPVAEGRIIAFFPVLKLSHPESLDHLHEVSLIHNQLFISGVDCAFDPYSEEWITASVDLQVLGPEVMFVSINTGPFEFMTRVSFTSGQRIDIPYRRSGRAASTAFSSIWSRIACPGYTFFDVYDRLENRRRTVPNSSDATCGAYSPDGSYIVMISAATGILHLTVIDSNTLRTVASGASFPEHQPGFQNPSCGDTSLHLLWSKCGRYVGLSNYCRELVVFNIQLAIERGYATPLPALDHHEDFNNIAHPKAFDFALRTLGTMRLTMLALGTARNTICLYEVGDAALDAVISESKGMQISCLRFSNAEDFLAVALTNGVIDLLDSESLVPMKRLQAVDFGVLAQSDLLPFFHGFTSLSFCCSDNFLAAGTTDGLVRVWCVRRPTGPLLALCRTAIRSCCKMEDMSELPLSTQYLSYLMDVTF